MYIAQVSIYVRELKLNPNELAREITPITPGKQRKRSRV